MSYHLSSQFEITDESLRGEVSRALGELPREQVAAAIERLTRLRNRLDRQIAELQAVAEAMDVLAEDTHAESVPTKRDAVLNLFDEADGPLSLSEVRDSLIERGHLAKTQRAAHALQMTMSTLVREGVLERRDRGIYASNPDLVTASRIDRIAAFKLDSELDPRFFAGTRGHEQAESTEQPYEESE